MHYKSPGQHQITKVIWKKVPHTACLFNRGEGNKEANSREHSGKNLTCGGWTNGLRKMGFLGSVGAIVLGMLSAGMP